MTTTAEPRPPFWRARTGRLLVEMWDVLRRPSSVFGLGVLVFAGFVAGVMFWGGFNTALEVTNTEKFCTGCHEMRDNVFAELKTTIHFSNRSGVRAAARIATCRTTGPTRSRARCRRPRRSGAICSAPSTPAKSSVDHRLELALHEWARLKANNSLECRNCHSAQSMDITKQSPRAADRASALPVHRREDLHRLPQGHRPPSARHARRAGLAIARAPNTRKVLLFTGSGTP